MADNIAIDWAATPNVIDPVARSYQGAAAGYELGQKGAMIHALQGIDLNNPASTDAGIGALVRANALEQGNALQNLSFTRMLRQQIPGLMSELMGSSAAPTAAPAAPPAVAPNAQPTADPAHAIETFTLAKQAADTLANTPAEDRPAAFQAIKENMLKRGIPEQAIDHAGDDLSDAGLKSLSDYYGGLAAHAQHQMSPQAGAEAPPIPAPHPSSGWYQNVVDNPRIALAVGLMKSAGIDFSPYLEEARALAQPGITKQAELAYAGPIAATQAGVDVAKQSALIPIEAAKAGAVATAQEAAKAPWEFDTYQDPRTGQPTYIRKDFAAKFAAEHGGVLGQGIAPAEQAYQTAQAGQAAKYLEPDPTARQAAGDSLASAQRALSVIRTLKFDNLTDAKTQIARALRTAGVEGADKYATDIASYQTATTQSLVQGAKTAFPSRITDRDIKLMHQIYPTLSTPNDTAGLVMGTQAAQAIRLQQYEDFKANYSGEHNPQAIQRAWLAGPGGQSILQSPIWAEVPIGGKPAFNPATDVKTVNGVKWGAWGLGTGHPVYFEIH